jgi:hypothetical protein
MDKNWVLSLIDKYQKIKPILFDEIADEKSTQKLLFQEAQESESYFLYMHTKGVSKSDHDVGYFIETWRRCMEYFTIIKWRDCLEKFKENYDSVGILVRRHTFLGYHPHFSGGFWWTTSKTIKELDSSYLNLDHHLGRFSAEFWIGSNPNHNLCCLYDFNGIEPAEQDHRIDLYIK